MEISLINRLIFVASVINTFLYYIVNYFGNVSCQFGSLLVLFILVTLYAIVNREKTLVLLFFLVSFFTYLMSRDFFVIIVSCFIDEIDDIFVLNDRSQTLKFSGLYISLLFLFWGNYFFLYKFPVINRDAELITCNRTVYIRRFSLFMFYLTMIFRILQIVIAGHSMMVNSYANVDATPSTSHAVVLLAFLNTVSFIFYINTFPSKKTILRPLLCFIILTVFSVFMGERGSVVYTLLFVLIYFMSRDYYLAYPNRFLSKKIWWGLYLSIPFILIGLNLFAFIRSSEEVKSNGFLMDLIGFFLQQGGSSNLIYLVDDYKYSLPNTNLSYTFGPLINYVKDIFHLNTNLGWDSFTYEALYGNNLGATLTYITNPSYYYSGGGLGTQYIAELIADFGYIGVIVYNLFLGILLRYLSYDVKKIY